MQRPKEIKKIDERTLGIIWDDRHASRYDTTFLRAECGCAACVDEWTGEKKIAPSALPMTVRPRRIDSVGQYGLQIVWEDGHSTGIYTYEKLRQLCQCQACQ